MKILFIDAKLPNPDIGGGFPRAKSMLLEILRLGHNVTFLSHNQNEIPRHHKDDLLSNGLLIMAGPEEVFSRARPEFDTVIISRPDIFEIYHEKVRKRFKKSVVIYDAEAIFAMRDSLKRKVLNEPASEDSAALSRELELARKADFVISVSAKEAGIMRAAGIVNVGIWGHSHKTIRPRANFYEREGILFVGGCLTPGSPNEHAICFFVRQIFPLIQTRLQCRLDIVGKDPCESIRNLTTPSVRVWGYVPDLESFYKKSRVFVVPHQFSAGIPFKLTEAMSHGLPSVVSRHIADQMGINDERTFLIADDSKTFAEKVIHLHENREIWDSIRDGSLTYNDENCSPEKMATRLDEILKAAAKASKR